jgi:ribonuclease BN (tRNA processing enzyme)
MRRLSSLLIASIVAISIVSLTDSSQAQPNQGASPSKYGTRLITLGTRSGPTPIVGRAQSSNLLIVNGSQYLIDAGDGVTRRLTRLGTNFRNIGDIFITHPHSDHTGGLAALMGIMYDSKRLKPVNVYGPPGTEASVQGVMQFLVVSSEIRLSDGTSTIPINGMFSGHDTGVGVIFQDANVKVTAVENTHFHFKPGSPGYGKYKSYSYRFDTPVRSVVFTGDTGPSDAVTELAKGADLLVSEVTSPVDEFKDSLIKDGRWELFTPEQQASSIRHHIEEHLTPAEVGKIAAGAGVKTVVLTHLQPSPNDDYGLYVTLVKKVYSGQVLVAKDLMEF